MPSSLEVWTQRAGRAGQSPSLQARAILLAERSMFQQKKAPKKRKKKNSPNESQSEDSLGSESKSDMVWGKVVNPNLREWIVTLGCRRDITDGYFQNPGVRKGELIGTVSAYGRHTYSDLQYH